MENDTVIKVENLSKKFTRSLKRSMAYGTLDLTRNFLGINSHPEKLRKGEFWALKDIDFELKRGESIGLIGRNGSGKSTLLRLLTGIYPPDAGKISVRGKIGSLIAIGAGFHPHMSGRENIFLNGTILGMSRKELKDKYEEIVDFADIGEFIEAPVSTYSSGMKVRLGFSIAVNAVPEVLLVDEVLAVGDMNFQQKSMAKMGEIVEQGTSLVFVSHQMGMVQNICNKAVLLEGGQIVKSGEATEVVAEYYAMNSSDKGVQVEKPTKESTFGITANPVKFHKGDGVSIREFETDDDIYAEWSFNLPKPMHDVVLTFSLSDGVYTYNGYQTYQDGIKVEELTSDSVIKLKLNKVALSPGEYVVSIGIWDEKMLKPFYWDYETTGRIKMKSTRILQGRFQFQHEWDLENIKTSKLNQQ